MKPAKFDYFAPTTLDETLELLAQHGLDAKVLAGGQSLMPMMNLRLVRPAVVIDINRVDGLSAISATNGTITVGALTRQRDLESSGAIRDAFPMMTAAISHIGHFQIRNRGTIGGSLAHADPAAELPALCTALDAEFVVADSNGMQTMAASEFAIAPLITSLAPEQLLTEVRLPTLGDGWRWGFREVSRREGDFALVGAVAMLRKRCRWHMPGSADYDVRGGRRAGPDACGRGVAGWTGGGRHHAARGSGAGVGGSHARI